ncbi:phycocyanobilin:Cys-153 beta-phycocyanin lyase [Acaryochloris thomasi RCC1774]|uniref:Chromophore lyase CpcT/CpeT n=1 Tax=Acaryochloris thomasi RCC1774 TaxID=1764569 RepID=A0A2W1J9R5_9CYAN|nr:chromophore lyase CpcT/CpeT [Acaryochloris thomasi]PZD70776.1 phycocyanobilin:Cys-153 beta-phycocyanin lyase [Acaryochloris thomasi RCC1774]
MTHNTDIATLARWMAGDFSNQEQAFENPPFFAHIRVCMHPLALDDLDAGVSFYLEQAYDYQLQHPYRTRVLSLMPQDDCIIIRNYRLNDAEKFIGAARQPERLDSLAPEDLEVMEGCNMVVQWQDDRFKGRVEPGKACRVVRKGMTTYLDSTFEIDEKRMRSFDCGRDPETDQRAWGSVAGPFQFQLTQRFHFENKNNMVNIV